jgi:Flp pilus assembly protein CpaB
MCWLRVKAAATTAKLQPSWKTFWCSRSARAWTAPVITLAVSPDDAQKLALVSQEGRIQLSLRNPMDTRKGGIGATRTSSLYLGETPVATAPKPKAHKVVAKGPAPAPAPYQVEMIRGSKRDETKFEENK